MLSVLFFWVLIGASETFDRGDCLHDKITNEMDKKTNKTFFIIATLNPCRAQLLSNYYLFMIWGCLYVEIWHVFTLAYNTQITLY